MKILSVCQAGTVRSGALTIVAKGMGHDALQAGIAFNPPATLKMLVDWADVVLLAEPWIAAHLPPEAEPKLRDTGLGPDRWQNPLHPELLQLATVFMHNLR